MDVGYFFIGDTGLHVARHLAQEISNMHFISLHKTARTEDSYRQLLALPSRLSPIDMRFTDQYYNEIPDYIESPKGKVLFCSTAEAQFGSLDVAACAQRIQHYAHIMTKMYEPYDQLVFVMRPGQSTGELGIASCLDIAQKMHKQVTVVTTHGMLFEENMKTAVDAHLKMMKKMNVQLKVIDVPICEDRILDTYNHLYVAMAKQTKVLSWK
jgi:hypothetical protein